MTTETLDTICVTFKEVSKECEYFNIPFKTTRYIMAHQTDALMAKGFFYGDREFDFVEHRKMSSEPLKSFDKSSFVRFKVAEYFILNNFKEQLSQYLAEKFPGSMVDITLVVSASGHTVILLIRSYFNLDVVLDQLTLLGNKSVK
ncbi:hypothetical protein G9A89_001377 [Geosiphon pyriformis]|nr:hypothetical protein G9A89_001377 [Geosiphon pyriformis]